MARSTESDRRTTSRRSPGWSGGGWIVALRACAMAELGLRGRAGRARDRGRRWHGRPRTDPDALRRLLRSPRRRRPADAGRRRPLPPQRAGRACCAATIRPAVRSLALMQTWGPNAVTWARMADAVATGEGTFEEANGAPLWETLSRDPEAAGGVQRGDGPAGGPARPGRSGPPATWPASARSSTSAAARAVCWRRCCRTSRGLRGVLADRAGRGRRGGSDRLARAGRGRPVRGPPPPTSSSRCPPGGDAYVLSSILHDWPDEDCLRILAHRPGRDGAGRAAVGPREGPRPGPAPARADGQAELHLLDLQHAGAVRGS